MNFRPSRKLRKKHKNPVPDLFGISAFTERAAATAGGDLRGLGICPQQAFAGDTRSVPPAKYANLYKFALLASFLLHGLSVKSCWNQCRDSPVPKRFLDSLVLTMDGQEHYSYVVSTCCVNYGNSDSEAVRTVKKARIDLDATFRIRMVDNWKRYSMFGRV